MFDCFARRVAEGDTSGEYEFTLCDGATSNVFSYTHTETGIRLLPFAWGVFEAFDQEEKKRGGLDAEVGRGY